MAANNNKPVRFGALPEEWDILSILAGLTTDLVPVVSNPDAVISPRSSISGVGKLPSVYNAERQVVGLQGWTKRTTTDQEIVRWRSMPDYGIGIITRLVRGLDVDVSCPERAKAICDFVNARLPGLPCRGRSNSPRVLFAFTLEGEHPKRVLNVGRPDEKDAVEFLANGQMFVAAGAHKSGARYEWVGGTPMDFPSVSIEQFDDLWSGLVDVFGTEPPVTLRVGSGVKEPRRPSEVPDELADYLAESAWFKSHSNDGTINIHCPFEHNHTEPSNESSTRYFPAGVGGYEQGHFKCFHKHCAEHTDGDFVREVGFIAQMFDELPPEQEDADDVPNKYRFISLADLMARKPPQYFIRDVLPHSPLTVVYAESGVGKTFFILDATMAVARGIPWRGLKTKQARVAYICAEGAGGFGKRIKAYAIHHDVDLSEVPFTVLPAAPNFLQQDEIVHVVKAIREQGGADIIVVDTFAQVTPGANENAGEDMGKAIAHCGKLHQATGAAVILIHHAGKDPTRGARGWSGIRAAADAEIEITRTPSGDKVARITKQKDGEDGLEFYFGLQQVPIGMDEEGDTITSCVLVEKERTESSTPARKLGRNEQAVLSAIQDFGKVQSAGIEIKAVIDEALRLLGKENDPKGDAKRNLKAALTRLARDENAIFYVDDETGCIELCNADDLAL